MEEIKIPKVSMGQAEGTISDWLVEEGTWVEKDQLIMVMETEKVAYELESPGAGFIIFQVELQQNYPCGTVAALLAKTEEEKQNLLAKKQSATLSIPQTIPAQKEAVNSQPAQPKTDTTSRTYEARRIRITPVAKKKAQLHQLDYSNIQGTGPNGRIKMCDIELALSNRKEASLAISVNTSTIYNLPSDLVVIKSIPLIGIRKTVATNVSQSQQVAAQTHFSGEVDVKRLVKLRKKLNAKLPSEDKITYNDLLIYIMARAIPKVPIVNSSLIDGQIKVWETINIGLAVAIQLNEFESGLFVPVIHHADKKSLLAISRETKTKIAKAKSGKLSQEDQANGTITLSPLGSIVKGYTTSTPIIQQPQSFVINSGAITERVVPIKGKMKIRPIMTLSCTFDHRIMDGVPALTFFNTLKEMMEDLDLLFLT